MKPLWIALVSVLVGGISGWTLADRRGEKEPPSADHPFEAPPATAGTAPDPASLARRPSDVPDAAALRARIAELERRVASGGSTGSAPKVLSPSLEGKSTAELLELVQVLRKRIEASLLAPSPAVASRYANLLSSPLAGQARLLPRGQYDHVIESRGGGATTRSRRGATATTSSQTSSCSTVSLVPASMAGRGATCSTSARSRSRR